MTTSQHSPTAIFRTDLDLPGRRQGKVRDLYEIPGPDGRTNALLIVASDRVSAFDVVMPTPIPGKGRLLTEISVRWFDFIRRLGVIDDHLISASPADVPGITHAERQLLDGRIMIGRLAEVIPIEFVVRGYITGSGWKDYQKTQSVCGIPLAPGLTNSDKLPEPIFTPATKADVGHDENIDFDQACDIAGRDVMENLRDVSIEIYTKAAAYALSRGIILADTKFEFGYALDADGKRTDQIILIDEVLTPDSSRFWPADEYKPGREQNSFDKQYVRNYLEGLVTACRWNKIPPGPKLPEVIITNTLARYQEARTRLFG